MTTEPEHVRSPSHVGGVATLAAAALVLAALAGVGGVLWERLWTPPLGIVYQGQWFLEPAGPDHSFTATGWYVVVGLVVGVVPAAALGWWCRGHEWWLLGGLVVGCLLGGWLMYVVGHALGPSDPSVTARTAEDFTTLPAELTVARTGYLAIPVGAMLGLGLVTLLTQGRGTPAPPPTPTWGSPV